MVHSPEANDASAKQHCRHDTNDSQDNQKGPQDCVEHAAGNIGYARFGIGCAALRAMMPTVGGGNELNHIAAAETC